MILFENFLLDIHWFSASLTLQAREQFRSREWYLITWSMVAAVLIHLKVQVARDQNSRKSIVSNYPASVLGCTHCSRVVASELSQSNIDATLMIAIQCHSTGQ